MSKKEDLSYVNPFIRGAAASIDMFCVALLRIIFMQLIGYFWVNGQIIKFHKDFEENFGGMFNGSNPEHLLFLSNHEIVKVMLIFLSLTILVGAFYHAYLNSSSWSSTLGKRLFKVILVKNEGKSLTFFQAFWHYCLSLLPWIFMFYLVIYQLKNKVSIYDALTGDPVNLTLGLITVAWIQIHIITKKKSTPQDMIIGCTMVRGKLGKGWPKIRSK